ncbi:MAG: nucleotide exchange factor GrpE [Gemmatimonadetes bacterium]|nr:MAG: nucleotide exchange factor GrpE [Gemmatimonadota bacterium]
MSSIQHIDEPMTRRSSPQPDDDERYLRLLSEFTNYKRRTEQEKRELADYVRAETYRKLLPILDDFDRLMSHQEQDERRLIEGVTLIYNKLRSHLAQEGLVPESPQDEPFDPNQHDAFLTQPTDDPTADQTVAQVLEKGYRFKGKLIRPAKVAVAQYT